MPDPDPRRLLMDGVAGAALMQVATLGDTGSTALCHVWFQASFGPDRLFFLSRQDRDHAANIRRDPRVAGAIALEVPAAGLGGLVRGVTLTGLAREIPEMDRSLAAAAFVRRWPAAANVLTDPIPRPARRANSPVPKPSRSALALAPRSRLYEIAVAQWVLFDEVNFPDRPKQTLPAG